VGARLSHVFMVVSDLEAQRRLLVDVVGLRVLLDEGDYVRIGGDVGFHLGLEEGTPRSSCDGLEINIQVDDVDGTHRRLLEAGVLVEGPPEEQEWGGRHVWFRDVDGRRMSVFG
jgi:catechol 2,3-dioxygenase-like lactoylglutathione lyase family enzyme